MLKYSKNKENRTIKCRDKLYSLDTPLIMGILNMTPDSFYAKSRTQDIDAALFAVEKMIAEGVNIIDVGGVSTRPNADLLTEEEELLRVLPIIKVVREKYPSILISIDTFRANVAKNAIAAGADIVNDVYGGKYDSKMFATVAALDVPYILMHCRGTAKDMQQNCVYQDVVNDVIFELSKSVFEARRAGVKDVIIDPGFGFSKTIEQNYELFKNLAVFKVLDCPILIGISRKSMLYNLFNISPEETFNATSVLNTLALLGNIEILRVHDVKPAVEAIKIMEVLKQN